MSSLARQLASIASLDSSRLSSSSSKPSSTTPSYLFTPTEAAQHDLETIHSLGLNGFEELKELDPSLQEYEDEFFGEGSKGVDRMVIGKEENEEVGRRADALLRRLGRHVPTRAAAKVVEWLVRRFRVHEMNVEGVLACFLPYHDSPQFVRILAILRIPKNSSLSFLLAPQSSHLPLTRHHLIASLTKDKSNDLLRLVTSLLPKAIEEECVHRTLVNFHAATLVAFIEHGGATRKVGDAELTVVVPSVVEGLKGDGDCVSANYIVLLALSRKATLTPQATHALLLSILHAASPNPQTSEKVATQLTSTVLGLLQSQDEVPEVGQDVAKLLSKIPDFGKLMAEAAEKYEMSKAMRPVLKAFATYLNLTHASATLQAFIGSPIAPPPTSIIPFVLRTLLAVSHKDAHPEEARIKLLAILKERHAGIWEVETSVALAQIEDDEDKKTAFLALCDAVSGSSNKTANGGLDGDVFLNVNSADSTSRLAGVKSLLEKLVKGAEAKEDEMDVDADDDDEFRASAASNLLARLADPYLPIIQAIYSSPSLLFTTVPSASVLLSTIVGAINTPSVHKSIVRRHLQFLAGPFATRYPEMAVEIVQQAFFGGLLITKPRQVMASGAWEVLAGKLEGGEDGVLVRGGMFDGLAEEVVKALGDETEGKHEKQAAINVLIASKIGANIMESSSFSTHVNFLLAQLSSTDAHPRILAHLVLAVVLRSLSGQRAVEIGIKIVERLRSIPGALEALDVTPEGQAEQIVLKPNSPKTTQRARGSLLLTLQTIKIASPVVWLDAASQTAAAKQVAHLSYLIYGVVNSSLAPPALSTPLLRSLFTNLRDDALVFLASIWSAPVDHAAQFSPELRTAALRHADAFLRAHVKENGKDTVDFQTIVPALIVALGSPAKTTREAALGCLKLVGEVLGEQSGVPYALETIYGVESKLIQVLKPADLRRYIDTLLKDSAALVIDPGHVVSLHQNYLTTVKGEKRTDANFKRGVLCFLLSHVAAWSSPSARIALLQTCQPMRAAARVETLHPVLERLVQQKLVANDETKVLVDLLFDSYDRSSLSALNETPALWVTFKDTLVADASIDFGRLVRRSALAQLQTILYQALPGMEQVEVCELLIRSIVNEDTVESGDIKATLRSLSITSEIMVAVLAKLRSTAEVVRGPKKSKQDTELHAKALQAFHRGLVVVIEARSLESLEGDATLLAALLDILASLLDSRSKSDLNVDYPEQLLLTALCSIAAKVESIPVAEQIDVNTVIKVISDCRNPQTFQQGLLLISTLARLVPALVLQNVLPIFISVGANAVQRDDAYTFRVVEKTIESIIPVMISQRREETTDRLQLWNQSRELLLVFTGMAPHLPAHRKTRLFSHLVEALGPSDFLGPICMLLLEKASSKLKSKSTADPLAAFALPLSLIESFAGRIRFEALNDVASEAGRLLLKLGGDEVVESFLGGVSTVDVADTAKVDRRRIATLLTFLHLTASAKSSIESVAGTNAADKEVQSLVGQLLNLRSVANGQQALEGADEIIVACQTALDSSTKLLSVTAFADALGPLLQGSDIKMQLAAFGLLANRLPSVKPEARASIAPTMVLAITTALPLIASTDGSPEIETIHVLQAVEVIASSATAQEDTVLTKAVETLLAKGKKVSPKQSPRLLATMFSLLAVLNRRLGPRLIPFIKPFVALSVSVLDQGCKDLKEEASTFQDNLLPFVLSAVGALVASVPTFMGGQLVEVLSAVLRPALLLAPAASSEVQNKPTSPVQSLLNVVAKTVPSKSAFPAVFELWAKVQKDSAASIGAFFDLLRRVLRNAGRDALNAQLKPTFAFFLTAFDLRWTLRAALSSAEEITAVETKVMSAFMEIVVKLSEGTFRPLFVRVYDWAAVELVKDETTPISDPHLTSRRTTLFSLMDSLLEKFKNIMTPYTDIVLEHAIELLEAYADEKIQDQGLWTMIMGMFRKSFNYDQAAFWTDAHLTLLLPHLTSQLPFAPHLTLPTSTTPTTYADTLAAFASTTSSPSLLKQLNTAILMHTRSADATVRALALDVTGAVWARAGEDMLELVPQAVSDFIAECVEDEDENVEKAARRVLVVLENLVGPLGAFLGDE